MNFFSYKEYTENVKSFGLEEPFDFLLFRPFAYVIIKLTYALPLNPNHFSIFALITSILSGLAFSSGKSSGFIFGGFGILLFSILDCCDGMLARMKGNGSKYGELIDIFIDVLSNIFFYGGLFIGFRQDMIIPAHFLLLLAAFFILLHASIYNYFKQQFSFYTSKNPQGRQQALERYRNELFHLKVTGGNTFNVLLLEMYLMFSQIQKKNEDLLEYDIDHYIRLNQKMMPLWGLIAGSTHLAILAFSLIFSQIEVYLSYALVFANLWLFFVMLIQVNVNKKLKRTMQAPST